MFMEEKNMTRKKSVTQSIVAIALVLLLAMGVLATFVTTRGVRTGAFANGFTSDYDTKADMIASHLALNERIAEEGMVLLTNEIVNPSAGIGDQRRGLPLQGANPSVTVFGRAAFNPIFTTGGDILAQDPIQQANPDAIIDSLTDAGIRVNQAALNAFSGLTGAHDFAQRNGFYDATRGANSAALIASYTNYNDAAIVVLTATGASSEWDGRRVTAEQAYPNGDMHHGGVMHNRMIDRAQMEILAHATTHFESVIVLFMDTLAMDIPWLLQNNVQSFEAVRDADGATIAGAGGRTFNDAFTVDFGRIHAGMQIGRPGFNGFAPVGRLLQGTATPSGRLSDVWPAGFQYNPTWQNTGNNMRTNGAQLRTEDGLGLRPGSGRIDYQENIFMGMHYYETRGFVEQQAVLAANASATEAEQWAWYDTHMAFTLGHGLSFTSFDWEITSQNIAANANLNYDHVITMEVLVTNTGDVAGREVVQLYYTAPYTLGGIEKSHVVLGDFQTTDLLAPGASQTLTVSIPVRDMASFDWDNRSGLAPDGGFVLSAGTYTLRLMRNAHVRSQVLSVDFNVAVASRITYSRNGEEVRNQFNDVNDEIIARANRVDVSTRRIEMSRENFAETFPVTPSHDEMIITDAEFLNRDALRGREGTATAWDPAWDIGQPWYVPAGDLRPFATEEERAATILAGGPSLTLRDLMDAEHNDARWQTLIDYVTLDEALYLVNLTGYGTHALEFIGKPRTMSSNGPDGGWRGGGLLGTNPDNNGLAPVRFADSIHRAQTFSQEIAFLWGRALAEHGLWGNSDAKNAGDNAAVYSYNGMYAPTVNLIRSPFQARVREIYSSDAFLSGMMGANMALGMESLGGYVYMKHFAMHEDAMTFRGDFDFAGDSGSLTTAQRGDGLGIWANEQAMREIYFWAFQLIIERGSRDIAVMSSFSRIGHTWAGGSWALQTQVLRNEWGFRGYVINDIDIHHFLIAQQWIRAGTDGNLTFANAMPGAVGRPARRLANHPDANTPTQIMSIRRAVKNILWITSRSNAMQAPLGSAIRFNNFSEQSRTAYVGLEFSLDLHAPIRSAWVHGANGSTNIEGWVGFDWNTRNVNLAPITFAITDGVLPAGLTLSNGVISGNAVGLGAGVYTIEVTASAEGFIPYVAEFDIIMGGTLSDAIEDIWARLAALEARMEAVEAILNGRLSAGQLDTLIETSIAAAVEGEIAEAIAVATSGALSALEVQALIDAATSGALTTQQVADMINYAIAVNNDASSGCMGTDSIIMFSILAVALLGLALFVAIPKIQAKVKTKAE